MQIKKVVTVFRLYITLPCLFLLCACGTSPLLLPESLILDNVTIVDVSEGRTIEKRQIWIANGKIQAIKNTNSEIPEGYRYINLNGQYVSPGLIDAHVHLMDKSQLKLSLAMGVTSVRILRGYEMHLAWKQELQQNKWLGASMYVSSPVLDYENTHELNQPVATPEQARKEVRRAKDRGFDLIKAYGYLSPDVFDAVIDEATKIGIPVAKHGPHPVPGGSWDNLNGLQSFEHVEDVFQGPLNYQFDFKPLSFYIEKLKNSGTPVVPTLATFAHLQSLSNGKQSYIDTLPMEYMNPFKQWLESKYTVSRWLADSEQQSVFHNRKSELLLQITKALHENGITLVAGSDAGTMYLQHGYAMHEELKLLSKAHIPNADVLRMATINAATMLNEEEQLGSVEENKVADLIISSRNPLEHLDTLTSPSGVIKKGVYLDQQALATLKDEATQHSSFLTTAWRLMRDYQIRSR